MWASSTPCLTMLSSVQPDMHSTFMPGRAPPSRFGSSDPLTRALRTSTSFWSGCPLVLLGPPRCGHGGAGHHLRSHFGAVGLRVATDDGRDVEIRMRNRSFVDPFADERSDRDVRVDAVKGVQCEVEILAEVAQREHRRLGPMPRWSWAAAR